MDDNARNRYELAINMIRHRQFGVAIEHLENNLRENKEDYTSMTLLGVALARSGRDLKRAEKLCSLALQKERDTAAFYSNLAEIWMRRGLKKKAIATLNAGLKVAPDDKQLLRLMARFGSRKKPVFSFLDRSNPINRYAGALLASRKH